jgi:WD40 repeat protein
MLTLSNRAVMYCLAVLMISALQAVYFSICVAGGAIRTACNQDSRAMPDDPSQRAFGQFALAADGGRFAVTVDDGPWSGLFAYDVASGRLTWQRSLTGPASSMALSPNGRTLALTYSVRLSGCPHIELLDGSNGQSLTLLQDRATLSSVMDDSARSAAFSPDGALVAAALTNEIRVWDVAAGRNASVIQPPGIEAAPGIAPVEQLVFSPDGKRVAGVSSSRPAVYLWDLKTQRLERALSLRKFSGAFGAIAFSRDGLLLAAESNEPIAIWNTRNGAVANEIMEQPGGSMTPVGFLNGGRLVVNSNGMLQLWDVLQRPPARDPSWQAAQGRVDAAFVVSSGDVVGVVGDARWNDDPVLSGRIRLFAAGREVAIASFEVPGRATGR